MPETAIVLVLILTANGAPILARHFPLLAKLDQPLDRRMIVFDGRRLLGASKTWRGLFAAGTSTTLVAVLLECDWYAGLLVAALAMLGDCASSFIKRRLGMQPGAMALGLDQVPEALLPALYWRHYASFAWPDVLLVVVLFFFIELLLSRLLYTLKIRKRPY